MKEAGALTVAVVLVVWLSWNVANLYSLTVDLRDGSWRRPMWWTRLCSVALFVGFAAWVRGLFSGSYDVAEVCSLIHHENFDREYRSAHLAESRALFPLHNKCNAHYDLVPAWVNPTVVVCAVVVLVSVLVLIWYGARRFTTSGRRLMWAGRTGKRTESRTRWS